MTTVIMLFALPIGVLLYFWDKKNVAAAERLYDGFIDEVKENDALSDEEKLQRIDKMLYANGYKRVQKGNVHLVMEKRHLNLGVPVILFALLSYVGIAVFLIYFFYFLKPLRKEVTL